MRPILNRPWGGSPHLRLNEQTYVADPDFRWGWQRWTEIGGELADATNDGREPYPTETHRRIARCLRYWLRTRQPERLGAALKASLPDGNPFRQLVEDLYLAVSKDEGLENWNHDLFGGGRDH